MKALEEYYNSLDFKYGMSRSRKARIISLLGDVTDKVVLDVGCAGGYFGEELKKLGAREVSGIDLSTPAVTEAEKRLDKAFVTDIQTEKTSFSDNYFDIIIFSEVIEHLLFPERALLELRRVLKDDGMIIVTTPNLLVFSNRVRMMLGIFEYKDASFFERGHIHFFTVSSLKKILTETGFTVDKTNNLIHPKVPVWLGNILPNLFAYQAIFRVKRAV